MSETLILHHYDLSPYAEKIRLMLGYKGMPWQSVLSPEQPPRPNVDPLSGGYRRIPIAQIGADIFCDTFVIAQEVARASGAPELDPQNVNESDAEVIRTAEEDVFFAAIGGVSPMTLVGTMLRRFGLMGTIRFAMDRARMMQDATIKPPQGKAAQDAVRGFLETLDERLAGQDFLGGAAPALVDFSAFHPLWLYTTTSRQPLDPRYGNVVRWFERIESIGHGSREEVPAARAFESARASQPRALPDASGEPDSRVGTSVAIAPTDYGTVPVTGTLVSLSDTRCILERQTEAHGTLHVHFPRRGFSISNAP